MPSGKSAITLDMTVYLHDKTLYEDWLRSEAVLECVLEASRGQNLFRISLPSAQLSSAQPNFDGAGSTQLSFDACWQAGEESVLSIEYGSGSNRNPMRDMETTE